MCDAALCNDDCDGCGTCNDATSTLMPPTTEEPTTPPPPECEGNAGQTFEYPGSCRDYFLCLEDGTSVVYSCCPKVYNPNQDSCVPEEVGGDLCSEDDVCSGAPNLNLSTFMWIVVLVPIMSKLIS